MPTSIAISPAYSIWRSLMSSAARLEDLEPPLPAEPEPRRLRAARGRDRVLDVGPGALRERPDEDVGVDRRADLERAVAVALRAVDDVAVDLAQPRLRPLQPCLVLLLQLLVVGAQGRVRDLDPLGGHSVGSPVQARREVGRRA